MMASKTFAPSSQNSDPNQEETPSDNVQFGSDLRLNDLEGSDSDESYEPPRTTTSQQSNQTLERSVTELQPVTPRTCTFAVKSRDLLVASNGTDRREKPAHGRTSHRLPSPRVGVAPADENEVWTSRCPSPSQFILRPMMPGYRMTPDRGYSSSAVQCYGVEVGGESEPPDLGLKQAIPAMPLTLAILCCIFNIVCPGLGKSHAIYVQYAPVCQGTDLLGFTRL